MSSDKMLSKEGAIVPPPHTIVNVIPKAVNDINLISEMIEILQLATNNI
jgi:hypothetical protein